ncbi:hypothetical protein NCC49_002690 [Naganishia albida]|nr:hypothetical protein NCC49_002690 [Naganishia albida]
MPLWPFSRCREPTEDPRMLFINRRSLRRPAPRNDVISDPRARLPLESQAGTYDADDEDLASNAIYEVPQFALKRTFLCCNDEAWHAQSGDHDHFCGRTDCQGTKRSPWVLSAVHSSFRPERNIIQPGLPQSWRSYHSALPKFRTSPSVKICGANSRLSGPQVIVDYSITRVPSPPPEHVLKIAPEQRWRWHPPLEERIAAWKRQQLREQPQRELEEASIVVGPPTDVDELNDCWVPAPPTPALAPYRRYINKRNPAMQHVFDIENRLPVPFVLESDDAACIESTGSDTHSDATYLTALPPLDSSTCSSPSNSVLVTPKEREQEPEFFLLRAEESADSNEEEGWQECANVSAALLTSRFRRVLQKTTGLWRR